MPLPCIGHQFVCIDDVHRLIDVYGRPRFTKTPDVILLFAHKLHGRMQDRNHPIGSRLKGRMCDMGLSCVQHSDSHKHHIYRCHGVKQPEGYHCSFRVHAKCARLLALQSPQTIVEHSYMCPYHSDRSYKLSTATGHRCGMQRVKIFVCSVIIVTVGHACSLTKRSDLCSRFVLFFVAVGDVADMTKFSSLPFFGLKSRLDEYVAR